MVDKKVYAKVTLQKPPSPYSLGSEPVDCQRNGNSRPNPVLNRGKRMGSFLKYR